MKKDLKTKFLNRKIQKPNLIIMSFCMCVLGMLNKIYKIKFDYDYDPKTIKNQPTILLSSHASRLEFIYTLYGFKRKDINMVCGFQNIFQKGLYGLFLKIGVISKYLYQPDFLCVKNMLKILKNNGAIGLFPEGIQSTSGSTHPINPATASFVKRSKANIVVCTTKGAYLSTNRYCKDRKKGYIGVSYSLLFTPEELEKLTEQEIYKLILEKISYNDFEYNKTARNKYIGKKPNIFGIDKILYKCPDCKKEHIFEIKNDTLVCRECGFGIQLNEYYDIVKIKGKNCPSDIDKWYKWQRKCVKEEIKDDSFEMKIKASLCMLRFDKLKKPPNNMKTLSVGEACLTNKGLWFFGSLDGKDVNFEFLAKSLYSLTFSTKGYLEFYYNNDYYMICPDLKDKCLIKWTLATEEIHNLYDEKWNLASLDVYNEGEKYE